MTMGSVLVCRITLLVIVTVGSAFPALSLSERTPKHFDWVDTSSPRATLNSLLIGTQRYYDLIRDEGYRRKDWKELSNIIGQAERLFDLRDIPPGHSHDVAHETAALVREALARVPLPALNEVPDEDEMAARMKAGKSVIYRVPNTPFEIARTEAGPHVGRYQFTKDTVAYARDFYDEIRIYPYQPKQMSVKGLYEAYFLSPGPWIPKSWIQALPDVAQHEFFEQTTWQWMFLVATVAFLIGAIFLLHVFIIRISRDWDRLYQNLLLLLRPLTAIVLVLWIEEFLIQHVRITGFAARAVDFSSHLIILFASVVITVVVGNVLAELIVKIRRFEGKQLDQQLIRLLVRVMSIVIAVVIVIEEMQQVGFSIATLVAGASVTGLALALAAQDALKNIFGGIELALDKPFEVGQRVKMKNYDGEIQEIGLRSTKIRTLSGHQVTIPNEDVAKLDVENVGRRPYIRRYCNIAVPYDTPPDEINRAVNILQEILSVPSGNRTTSRSTGESTAAGESDIMPEPHPNVAINQSDFPPRVYFNELNPDSLNILLIYWYHPPDYWDYLEHAHWINLQIVERFNSEGIDFAFPSQTLYHAGDEKRPLTIGQQWVSNSDARLHGTTQENGSTFDVKSTPTNLRTDFPSSDPEV
ncbi:MAG: mechanosensitive ion channel [Arenicellales bacterium]|nr:mechanosensitive ion channel [Arenicellales bacterium]